MPPGPITAVQQRLAGLTKLLALKNGNDGAFLPGAGSRAEFLAYYARKAFSASSSLQYSRQHNSASAILNRNPGYEVFDAPKSTVFVNRQEFKRIYRPGMWSREDDLQQRRELRPLAMLPRYSVDDRIYAGTQTTED